jgi:hypothetical protein
MHNNTINNLLINKNTKQKVVHICALNYTVNYLTIKYMSGIHRKYNDIINSIDIINNMGI